jgi:DNA-binding MarR family transcriptional regulator
MKYNKTMNKSKSQDSLPLLLLRVALRTKQYVLRLAEEYDLTLMQIYTLIFLEPRTQVPMNSISELLCCDASNVTGIVDRLSAAGYLERKDHATDRRIKCIELTIKGIDLRTQILHRLAEAKITGLTILSAAEADTLKRLITRVLTA